MVGGLGGHCRKPAPCCFLPFARKARAVGPEAARPLTNAAVEQHETLKRAAPQPLQALLEKTVIVRTKRCQESLMPAGRHEVAAVLLATAGQRDNARASPDPSARRTDGGVRWPSPVKTRAATDGDTGKGGRRALPPSKASEARHVACRFSTSRAAWHSRACGRPVRRRRLPHKQSALPTRRPPTAPPPPPEPQHHSGRSAHRWGAAQCIWGPRDLGGRPLLPPTRSLQHDEDLQDCGGLPHESRGRGDQRGCQSGARGHLAVCQEHLAVTWSLRPALGVAADHGGPHCPCAPWGSAAGQWVPAWCLPQAGGSQLVGLVPGELPSQCRLTRGHVPRLRQDQLTHKHEHYIKIISHGLEITES